ncbi:hypothetical protein P175DRAFT_0529297 [Aspergillus ochraceoroseus IBT 24754]|uniref:Beta-glucuronidase C-terminal domain-containing protein n=1 Tax=Aspergillus ochraceoroseus IBT 24754 TaxID=1392256 RepID=A0A2T5M164_9EURO|nr:uncharacterized protein P175DRAFT_0529297 [Aspergillus ochraceoroseus IBT 24754]PTU22259.1 hypothetical protein P175DRAFT_0529297 [Aspergillus ochraceoroseus IBT 24754]
MNIIGSTQAVLTVAAATQSTRQIIVDASKIVGVNSADSAYIPPGPWNQDTFYNKDPAIGALFPEYAIKNVLIYNFPDIFLGWGKTGVDGDPMVNDNYNWTGADDYMRFVTSNGAKATIQFQPTNGTNSNVSSPEVLGEIGYMVTDRYMNGAYDSGFYDALELFEFLPETDLLRSYFSNDVYEGYFSYFAAFSRAVTNASPAVGVAAWGGNQIYPVKTNYSVFNPYVSRFYKDCHDRNVPIRAASFHFINTQFSFDPYDIKRVTDKFRAEILVPAGLPNLSIWATEYEPAPFPALPTSASALASFNDPAWFASFTLGVSMYAQDTTIDQVLPWPGLGYNGTGAGKQPFQGFFNRSSSGPIPLNAAKAWFLQGKLVTETSHRVKVDGSSEDGFAALAGVSTKDKKLQILLNNYQLDYDIAKQITAQMASLLNTSASAYPLLQDNGLLNGESTCFVTGACMTFPQATVRNNTSQAYHLHVAGLPWSNTDRYELQVERVANEVTDSIYVRKKGKGNVIDILIPFPPNAQDLITVQKVAY